MGDAFFGNWLTQLRKGVLELYVLSILADESLYGYDIVRRLRTLDVLVISEGTIYPLLSRLRKEGLLKTHLKESPEGPARKYYELTSRGRRMLGEMRQVWQSTAAGVESARVTKGARR